MASKVTTTYEPLTEQEVAELQAASELLYDLLERHLDTFKLLTGKCRYVARPHVVGTEVAEVMADVADTIAAQQARVRALTATVGHQLSLAEMQGKGVSA